METMTTNVNTRSDTDAGVGGETDRRLPPTEFDRSELAEKLRRAADEQAKRLLTEAERIAEALRAAQEKRRNAWMTK